MRRIARLLPILLSALLLPRVSAGLPWPSPTLLSGLSSWEDSVSVAGRRFAVPAAWRGLRLGFADQAAPEDLVRLPAEYSFDESSLWLRSAAADAFVAMARAAAADGVALVVRSAYRSPATQRGLIAQRLDEGRSFEEIVKSVAPPGYSQHMLGSAVDLCLECHEGETTVYEWLVERAAEFGFVEGYPPNPGGFVHWEPWHWRHRGDGVEEQGPAWVERPPAGSDRGG